ncbi:hypothetical protein ACFWJC_06180 [Bacillus wiedmannii]
MKFLYVGELVPLALEFEFPRRISGRFVLAGPVSDSFPWATCFIYKVNWK